MYFWLRKLTVLGSNTGIMIHATSIQAIAGAFAGAAAIQQPTIFAISQKWRHYKFQTFRQRSKNKTHKQTQTHKESQRLIRRTWTELRLAFPAAIFALQTRPNRSNQAKEEAREEEEEDEPEWLRHRGPGRRRWGREWAQKQWRDKEEEGSWRGEIEPFLLGGWVSIFSEKLWILVKTWKEKGGIYKWERKMGCLVVPRDMVFSKRLPIWLNQKWWCGLSGVGGSPSPLVNPIIIIYIYFLIFIKINFKCKNNNLFIKIC